MANNKKFIVKNGLESQENVVIGTTTDDGVNKLQVTGSSKFTGAVEVTQSNATTPTVKFTNSAGPSALIAEFAGSTASIQITNFTTGDYSILNTGQNNGIRLFNDTAGLDIVYNGTTDLEFNSVGIDFKREPTYLGDVFWNAGNDGANSGLDADLLDGLDSTQFVRSDQDDTMSGNYIITGNLTVNGTTTTINTETVLIADNIITLNSNYTGSTPTESAGFEIERGTLVNSSLVWDETNDYFKLISVGVDLGRIITTADEGANNGFDADTVDGLQASQFLRSDVDDIAAGNITVQGDLTIGNGAGTAYIYLDGAGTNGVLASSAGEIGFLNSSFNYAIRVDTAGDIRVRDDIFAQKFIDINNNTYEVVPSVTSVLNNIDLEGALRHRGDNDTLINFPDTGRIGFTLDGVQYGLMTNTAFQYTGDVIADRFLDRSNNAYYVDPASSSVLNTVGIDSDLFHNGDTDNKISFGTDTQLFQTGGATRLTVNNTSVTSTVDFVGPRFVDSNNNAFFVDPASLSELNAANFYSGSANNSVNIGISATERFNIDVTGSQGYIRYIQNETNATDHSVNFEIISSGIGLNRFNFNKNVDVGSNSISGGFGVFSSGAYASIFYDYDDETFFADLNNTGNSINIAGTIRAGNGTLALPSYTFGSDTNTGMYRYGVDTIGFSAGGNDEFRILTTYTLSPGSSRAPIFYDSNNTAYYGDFASTSVMNRIGIDDYIQHNGDTDNYFGFAANDTFRVWTGGVQRLNIDNDSADFAVDVYAPRYYDSNTTTYYGDFASTSVMNRIDIDDYIRHNGNTTSYFGFSANNIFKLFTNNIERLNVDDDSADFAVNVFAPQFYTNDYLIHNGDTNTYVGFDANDQFGVWTNGVKQINVSTTAVAINLNTNITGALDVTGRATIGNSLTRPDSLAVLSNSAARIGGSDVHLHVASLSTVGNFAVAMQAGRQSDNASFPMALQPNGGNVSIGTLTSNATLTVNKTAAQGNNPFAAGTSLFSLGDVGVVDYSIRTDSFGNIFHINDNGGNQIWYTASAGGLFAILNTGDIVVNNDSTTYTVTDATTNFIAPATASNNKLHVSGSIAMGSINDVISIYGADGANTAINEATFLGVNELGFSGGGGFYMNDTATVRVRGNKAISTTGDIIGARFIDAGNNTYLVDPAGTSVMNRIDLDDYIRHNGDTDNYFGFAANDTFRVFTGGTQRLNVDNDSADFAVNVYAPRYYDSDAVAYYLDPNGDSQLNTIDLDDYIRHRGNTDAYFGWAGNNNFKLFTNGTERFNVDADSADFAVNVYAPRYYDSNDSTYYVDPASVSILNNVSFGVPGNGNTVKGRFLSIEGNTDASGEGSSRIFFAEHNSTTADQDKYGMALAYRGGNAAINSVTGQPVTLTGLSNGEWGLLGYDNSVSGNWAMRGPRSSAYVEARGDFRAPIFYDSNNTAFYGDFASTSLMNIVRVQQLQVDQASTFIDGRVGDYGTIRVEGTTGSGSWAGYAIRDDWVFMSDGAGAAGIFNDTDNEWSLLAAQNNYTRLYANGIHQIGAENGFALAPSNMRSPIFYDSDNTAYFADFAAGNTGQAIKVNGRIFREGFTADNGVNNTFLLAQDQNQFIWNTATNWGIFWATNTTAAYRHVPFGDNMISFVGAGNLRAAIDLDDGNAYFQGAVTAADFKINGGNEDLGILKTYGSGLGDTMMFDGTEYWEKRVIKVMQGAESNATPTTAEYVKNNNGPFASTYALRTNQYRTFDSDFIPVEPGEQIYGEIACRYISGTGGLLYMGVRRYDKDKLPITSNDGIEYFVVGGNNVTDTNWQTFRGHTTIPATHTPFNGSDGGACKYVRIVVLMNYQAAGALREFGPPILKRTNHLSNIVTQNIDAEGDVYANRYFDRQNTAFYVDPASISIMNDVRASIYYDRDNTARFMNPNSGGNVQGTWQWNNGSIIGLNDLQFNDPGPNEGIHWAGGNNWRIYESPDNLTTNSAGNLQILYNNNQVGLRINTSGDGTFGRYSYAQRFYDSNDGNFYGDFASTSVVNQFLFTNSTPLRFNTTAQAIFVHESDSTPVAFDMRKAGNSLSDGGNYGVLSLTRTNHNNGATGAGAGLYFQLKDSAGTLREYAGIFGRKTVAGTGGGELVFMNYARNELAYLNASLFSHNSSIRAPIFYDSNDTAFYGDFASTSIVNILRANQLQLDGSTYIIDSPSGQYGSIQVDGALGGWAGYAIRDDWVFMSSGAGNAGIFNDTNNQWALLAAQNSDVQIYFAGTWEERSRSGYMEARGSYRAPIFYDSNNTAYLIDGNGTSRLLTLNVDNVIGGSVNGYASFLASDDNRIIAPNEDPAGRLQFGFTSWNNNNTAPYADYLHLRSFGDASGGSDNLLMFRKDARGMRLWQQTWNSATAYSAFSEFAIYNSNPGSGNDMYASIYYDSDDTTFRVDPNGISTVRQMRVAGRVNSASYTEAAIEVREFSYGGAQADTYAIAPRIGFHWGGRVASQIAMASNGEIRILNNPGTATENFRANILYGDSDMRAPIFYDNNNTAYRGDFASTSRMNRVDADSINILTRGNFITFYADAGDNHAIGSRDAGGGATDDIRINTYGSLFVNLDSNNNNSSAADFRIGRHGSGTGSIQQLGMFDVFGDALYVSSIYSFRAPIFYDLNNTAYYTDPASTSVMNAISLQGILNVNNPLSYSSTGVTGLTNAPISTRNYDVNVGTTNTFLPLTHQTALYNEGYRTHVSTGLYKLGNSGWGDNNNGWYVALGGNDSFPTKHWKLTYGTELFNSDGFVSQSGSFRAPIFYDSNNTAFYFDGASVNSTRFEGVSNRTKAMMGLPGRTPFSAEFYSARPRITSDQNYWTGSMGWGTIDFNNLAHWGSGFIDTWSNPGNQPSGTSHWVGTQAWHYTDGGNARYGWQMVGGPIGNLRFRKSWAGFDAWRTIPMLNVNDGNVGAMYANIYYDSDNTGFYVDPTAFTNLNTGVRATDIYARSWLRNDNASTGLYNQATGTHFYSSTVNEWRMTGNNDAGAINIRGLSTFQGSSRFWLHGATDGYQGFLNANGSWLFRMSHNAGLSPGIWFYEAGESWTGNIGADKGKIEYHANRMYIVSGSNSDRIVQFRRDGGDVSWIANDGVFVGTATSARWADLAERYSADAIYAPGTILGINLEGDSEVTLYQPGMPVAGAVSTNPAYRMNEHIDYGNDNSIESKMNPFIALKGRIPVLINGFAKKGQWIIADKDGKGKAVDYGTPGINSFDIIGIALENGKNEVEVKI